MTFCKFRINKFFKDDPHWEKYGDVRIDILDSTRQIEKGFKVYLIPSGRVTNLISHTILLKNNPEALRLKKNLTERYVAENQDRKHTGFLFFRFFLDIDYPYVYNFDYDDFLNLGLHDYRVR